MIRTKSGHIIINCINLYALEGSEAQYPWVLEVIDNNHLMTEEIAQQLKQFDQTIYFNDLTCKHWIFDFKVGNVWFESMWIDCNNMRMVLNAYQ